jgi:site-specific recombinase XerD
MTLRKAVREGIIPRNPAAAVKSISIPETDKVFLSSEEIQQLLARTPVGGELGADVRRAFLFGCFSGLRISDLNSCYARTPLSPMLKADSNSIALFNEAM